MGKRKSVGKKYPSKKGFTRRDFIKTSVAAGVAASVGPWFIKDALSSSGSSNCSHGRIIPNPKSSQRLKNPPELKSKSPITAATRNV